MQINRDVEALLHRAVIAGLPRLDAQPAGLIGLVAQVDHALFAPVLYHGKFAVLGAAALSTFVGGLVMTGLGSSIDEGVIAFMLALTIGLLAYIVCGTVALKRGRTMRQRTLFLAFAVLAYAYIVSVALTRSSSPWV